MSEYSDCKNDSLDGLMSKWTSACSDFEAARKLAPAEEPKEGSGEALTNLMMVKEEIDKFISAAGQTNGAKGAGPFVVGIINLTGKELRN